MKTVLLFDSLGPRYFQRTGGRWRLIKGPSEKDTLWVLVNLPDETMDVIDMPRLLGSDRANFLERRLSTALSDTPFRTATVLSGGTFKPGKVLLSGLATAKDIADALKRMPMPIAGVWGVAALMAMTARRINAPDLLLAMPSANELRIIAVKDHIPLLTRCLSSEGENNADEILRTLQYLENQRLFERGSPPPVLYLGDPTSVEEPLAKAGLHLLPIPKQFLPKGEAGWLHAFFEKAVSSPPSQWAPPALRSRYISGKVRTLAYAGSVVGLMVAISYAQTDLRAIVESEKSIQELLQKAQSLSTVRDQLAARIKEFNVDPDFVRYVMKFEAREISDAPSAASLIHLVSSALAGVPEARVKNLSFHLSPDEESSCSGTSGEQSGSDKIAAGGKRYAEVQMTVMWPQDYSMQAKKEGRKNISAALQGVKGVNLLMDPVLGTRRGRLTTGDADASSTERERWCLQVPWHNSTAEEKEPK